MKTLFTFLLVTVIALVSMGCASSGDRASPLGELSATITEACDFYQKVKPKVQAYHDWARDHWDSTITLPDGKTVPLVTGEQKAILLELNSYLPRLDKAGQTICAFAVGSTTNTSRDRPGVDWDRVLSVTMKVASTAAQLKMQGAF